MSYQCNLLLPESKWLWWHKHWMKTWNISRKFHWIWFCVFQNISPVALRMTCHFKFKQRAECYLSYICNDGPMHWSLWSSWQDWQGFPYQGLVTPYGVGNLSQLYFKFNNDLCWRDLNQCCSLCPSDAIWWHRSGSTLAQLMVWCLMASSHYLNQLGPMKITRRKFHKRYLSHKSLTLASKLLTWNFI